MPGSIGKTGTTIEITAAIAAISIYCNVGMTAAGVDQYAAAGATAACCIVPGSGISITAIGQYNPRVNNGAGAYNNNAATRGAAGSQSAARAAGIVVIDARSAAAAHHQPQRASLREWG